MGKKSRARVAVVGTRKDPGRRVPEGKKADRAEKDKKVGAHAHPEWAPHLNTASEDLTAKLFTMVEVILGVVPVVVIGLFLASKDAASVDKLTDVFSQDPSVCGVHAVHDLSQVLRGRCGLCRRQPDRPLVLRDFAAQYSRCHRHGHLVVACLAQRCPALRELAV